MRRALLGRGPALGRLALARARGLLRRLAALLGRVAVDDAVPDRVARRTQVGERGLASASARLLPCRPVGGGGEGLGDLLAHAAGAQMVEEIVVSLVLGHGLVLPGAATEPITT